MPTWSKRSKRRDISPATISRKTVKGEVYLYADEKHGGTRRQRYIGPQIDPEAAKEAEQIQFTSQQAKLWRDQVTMIRRAGIPGPSLEVGRLLEAISRSGMFGTGLILVGTVAFGLYPLVVGKRLRGGRHDDAGCRSRRRVYCRRQR